jgi:hypothetical protein
MKVYDKRLIFCCIIYLMVIVKSLFVKDYIAYFTIPYFLLVFLIVSALSLIKQIGAVRITYMILSLLCIMYVLLSIIENFDFIVFVYFMIVIVFSLCTKMLTKKLKIDIGFWTIFFHCIQICLCIIFFLQYGW